MASPIGNLIHPPDPPYRQGSGQAPGIDSILHSRQPHPGPNPIHHLSPIGNRPGVGSGLSLAPLSFPSPSHPIPPPSHLPSQAHRPSLPSPVHNPPPPPLSRSHSNTQSLYQCADCLRRYSRPEHLQRHIATHTLGKRFICDICSKAFARADLLKRHRTNHQDDNGAKRRRMNSSPGAGRVTHACQACAKARVKCEEAKPCTRCKNRGISCEYGSSEDAALHLLHLSAHDRAQGYDYEDRQASYYPRPSISEPHASGFHTHYPSEPVEHSPMLTESEESHLPTPETIMDQTQTANPNPEQAFQVQATYPHNNTSNMLDDMAKLPFSDFLRDVLYDQSLSQAQGLAVLDFCDDSSLDLNAMDFGFLDYWLHDEPFIPLPSSDPAQLGPSSGPISSSTTTAETGQTTSDPVNISAMRPKLAQIWTDSPWRWTPQRTDNVYAEQSHLPLSTSGSSSPSFSPKSALKRKSSDLSPSQPTDNNNNNNKATQQQQNSGSQGQQQLITLNQHTLHSSGRDLILSIVLSICKSNSSQFSRVASSFPSSGSINHWIHIFLASHICSVSSFIACHLPPPPSSSSTSGSGSGTKDRSPSALYWSLNAQPPEWLAITAACGAVLAPVPALRKFGFALQEAVRVSIPGRFEENNSKVSDLGLVQALVLTQDLGVWSGNRRKMEIAECHLTVPVAMMRGRGKFTRGAYLPAIVVTEADEGKELEDKWKRWMEMESWKRLAFHAYLRDAQVSMTQLNNPSISYAEMRMPLPGPKECWFARTKEEWKSRWLAAAASSSSTMDEQVPCLGDLLRDVTLLVRHHHRLDVQFAISIYLHGFWSLIWEYRQLASIHRPLFGQPSSSSSSTYTSTSPFNNPNATTTQSLLISRLADLRTTLHQFHALVSPPSSPLYSYTTPNELLLLHLLLMHIHVSLEDLQLFSGKEGEEQAKRIYPVLQRWADSSEARQALWHAGQVLREFWAAAVHLGGLAVWGWGVLQTARGGVVNSKDSTTRESKGGKEREREKGQQQQSHHEGPARSHHQMSSYIQQVMMTPTTTTTTAISSSSSSTTTTPGLTTHHPTQTLLLQSTSTSTSHDDDSRDSSSSSSSSSETYRGAVVPLDDIATCMAICQAILRDNFPAASSASSSSSSPDGTTTTSSSTSTSTSLLPAISENIVALLGKLGGVAGVVGGGSSSHHNGGGNNGGGK
ncbi:uncharacterized protein B0T23DRAFT_411236 [Neurospora hispaniola]|uniref:Uncharacterized protein n=1 Tax=Neurospora hispaniola TaxID=588809 RepID=A0AAJ0MUE1_9PEZI|nr:hypothetical protein B0T23DRAFT_411236 [Neurospora hispaniola]